MKVRIVWKAGVVNDWGLALDVHIRDLGLIPINTTLCDYYVYDDRKFFLSVIKYGINFKKV